MARPRKRHVQQPLYFGDKNGQRRGDPRRRKRTRGVKLGRPPKGPRSSERHKEREAFKPNQPLHVTLRAIDQVGRLRTAAAYRAIREALIMTLWRESCRVVHLSIQHNHVHLLVEAESREALSRGMQGFQISAAKHINAEISKGRVKGVSWYQAKRRGLIPAERQRRKGTRVSRPLPRRDHQDAASGAERDRVRAQQLAQARRSTAPRRRADG